MAHRRIRHLVFGVMERPPPGTISASVRRKSSTPSPDSADTMKVFTNCSRSLASWVSASQFFFRGGTRSILFKYQDFCRAARLAEF